MLSDVYMNRTLSMACASSVMGGQMTKKLIQQEKAEIRGGFKQGREGWVRIGFPT